MKNNKRIALGSVTGWLQTGWTDFKQCKSAAMLYAALFIVPGFIATIALGSHGHMLILFILAAGFLLVAPVVAAGYYGIVDRIREAQAVKIGHLLSAFTRSPAAVWVVGIVSVIMFLIWVTDAFIIYSVYFGVEPVTLADYQNNPSIRKDVDDFIFYALILAAVLSFIVFSVTVFSVPHIVEGGAGLVEAVVYSVKGVFANIGVMLVWALIIWVTMIGAMVVFMPVALVLLPVWAFASLAAYREFSGLQGRA